MNNIKPKASLVLLLFFSIIAILNMNCYTDEEYLLSGLECSLSHPDNQDEVEQGSELTILVDAFADKGQIQRVEFFIDDVFADSCCEAPYFYDWNTHAVPLGKHVIKSLAIHKQGDSVSDEIEVTLIPWEGGKLPVADFETKTTRVNRTTIIQFSDLSENEVTGWQWTFGDGNRSTRQNPEKIYYKDGEYTVYLTVTNQHGKDIEVKPRYIKIYNSDITPGTFTDPRDGRTYNTVGIGGQTWLAENLDYEMAGSCYYDDDENAKTSGRLYTWNAATQACPEGWHLPEDAEWISLIKYIDPHVDCSETYLNNTDAGHKMKKTSGWYNYGNGSDEFGFGAAPAGCKEGSAYTMKEKAAFFWSSSEEDEYARFYRFSHDFDGLLRDNFFKSSSFSVRCVKDE